MDSCFLPAYRCAIEALYIFIGPVVHLTECLDLHVWETVCTMAQSPSSYAGIRLNRDKRKENSFQLATVYL